MTGERALLAFGLATLSGAAVIAWMIVGPLGIAILGLVTLLVATQVDLEGGSPIGHPQATDTFARAADARSREEPSDAAERREERRHAARYLRWAKIAGLVLTLAGGALAFFLGR